MCIVEMVRVAGVGLASSGAGVGTIVGLGVGAIVGAGVGDAEGAAVGDAELFVLSPDAGARPGQRIR